MISYPIFHDQPGLARRCQQLGVAVALTPELRGPVSVDLLQETIEKVRSMGQGMRDQLRTLREWEIETVERRPIVIKRILESALR
jgi:UDP:flavonoid glycosyltransferase YjiC (YdhE family)